MISPPSSGSVLREGIEARSAKTNTIFCETHFSTYVPFSQGEGGRGGGAAASISTALESCGAGICGGSAVGIGA